MGEIFWNDLDFDGKKKKISFFLSNFNKIDNLVEYFDHFDQELSKKTLNSFIKSVSNQ